MNSIPLSLLTDGLVKFVSWLTGLSVHYLDHQVNTLNYKNLIKE